MTEPNEEAFSKAIRDHTSPLTNKTMTVVESSLGYSRRFILKFKQRFELGAQLDAKKLHDMYVDAIVASSMLKAHLLNLAIIRAANAFDFLNYAFAGRALVETTATLRYYLRNRISPIVATAVQTGSITSSQLGELLDIEDHLLRGGRFDWLAFLTANWEALESGRPLEPSTLTDQVNVKTCIEKWAKDQPKIQIIYDLFCDMVHPSMGSMLCIAVAEDGAVTFPVDQSNSTGLHIFDRTFPLLHSSASKEFSEVVKDYILLKFGSQ